MAVTLDTIADLPREQGGWTYAYFTHDTIWLYYPRGDTNRVGWVELSPSQPLDTTTMTFDEFLSWCDELDPSLWVSFELSLCLSVVSENAPHVPNARIENRIRHDASVPKRIDQLVLTDDPCPMGD